MAKKVVSQFEKDLSALFLETAAEAEKVRLAKIAKKAVDLAELEGDYQKMKADLQVWQLRLRTEQEAMAKEIAIQRERIDSSLKGPEYLMALRNAEVAGVKPQFEERVKKMVDATLNPEISGITGLYVPSIKECTREIDSLKQMLQQTEPMYFKAKNALAKVNA